MCLLFQFRFSDDYFSAVNKVKNLTAHPMRFQSSQGSTWGCHSGFQHFCFKDTNPSPDSFLLMSGQRTRQLCNLYFSFLKVDSVKRWNLVTILHQPLFYCFCSIKQLCIRILNLVSQLLWFSLFLGGCTGLQWIMVAIFLCENGGLMVLPTWVNDCLKVFAKVARLIFVSNGGFTRNLQFKVKLQLIPTKSIFAFF